MGNQIETADFVLVVCTEIYEKRFKGQEEPKKGLGASWEGAILTQQLYDASAKNSKFIPVLFSAIDAQFVPSTLKSTTRYLLNDEYEKLYARLTSQVITPKPELGQLRIVPKSNTHDKYSKQTITENASESKNKPALGELHQVQTPHIKSNIPYLRNPFFTGREGELEKIRSLLLKNNTVALSQPVAVCGLGGIGKTQTAIEYAHRYFEEYEFVLWVKADSKDSIISDYAAVAKLLNLPVKEDSDQSFVASVVINWLKSNNNWLLVLDNADNPHLIKDFLPHNPQGHILLTSRAQVFDNLGITTPVRINKMLPSEAIEFFKRRTDLNELENTELDALQELILELDYLPLAIEQAGAYINKMQCTFAEYLVSYRKRGLELLEKSKISTNTYPKSVATTWLLNFEEIKEISLASVDLLFASAFLHCDKIPFDIFTKGHEILGENIALKLNKAKDDPLIFHEIIEPLAQFSLISVNRSEHTFDIHRLVQTVIKEGMNKGAQYLWAERIVMAINYVFPEVKFENWDSCDKLLPHALACSNLIKVWNMDFEESATLLNSIGGYLYARGRFGECESLLTRSLEIRKKIFDANNPYLAESLNHLAELYHTQGKYSVAETLYIRSLEIREKVLGPEHQDVAESLNNLAILYQNQGNYSVVEILLKRSLKIREKEFSSEHPNVADSLNNLAEVYKSQGRYSEAEPLLKRSLEIREKVLGPEHPDVADSLNNLAGFYRSQNKYADAEKLTKKSLELRKRVLGPEHPNVAMSLNNLATFYQEQGKYTDAEKLFKCSLNILMKILGPEHPHVATTFNNLAILYEKQGKYSDAEPLYILSLEIREKVLGSEHPDVATGFNNLAGFYQNQGKNLKAKELYGQAIKIIDKNKIENHPDSLRCLENYAHLLKKMRKDREAVKVINRIKNIRAKNEKDSKQSRRK